MSLPTPSQSVSHKRFHQCVNHKKKLSLRHPLPTFGSFSFFQASLWLGVDKVLQKLTKSYKSELRHLFQCCILIPRKCPRKTPFQHTVTLPPWFQWPWAQAKGSVHHYSRARQWSSSTMSRIQVSVHAPPISNANSCQFFLGSISASLVASR